MNRFAALCILVSGLQTGCLSTIAIVNGADASIPRQTRPDEGFYAIRLIYEDKEAFETSLRCERYYEAQASTRGNYWAWREVGKESQYQAQEIIVADERLGTIKFPLPTCDDLKSGSWSGGPLLVIHVGEAPYFYVRTKGAYHIYKPHMGVSESSFIAVRYRLEITYMKEPNQPLQRNAGSRPSTDDSPASETSSSFGPRG